MPSLSDLIERLPECENKGALRGLAAAATLASTDERRAILARMAAIVRRWRRGDPLNAIEDELRRSSAA